MSEDSKKRMVRVSLPASPTEQELVVNARGVVELVAVLQIELHAVGEALGQAQAIRLARERRLELVRQHDFIMPISDMHLVQFQLLEGA